MSDAAVNTNGNGGIYKAFAIAAAVAAVITPLYYQVQSHQEMLEELRGVFTKALQVQHSESTSAAYHRGRVDEKLSSLQSQQATNVGAIIELDNRLQREMRDLDAVADAKLAGLDERLQTEIGNISRLQQSDIEDSRQMVVEQRAQQISNQEEIARLQEQVKHLAP